MISQRLKRQKSLVCLLVVANAFGSIVNAFVPRLSKGYVEKPSSKSELRESSTDAFPRPKTVNSEALKDLEKCESGILARRVLEKAFVGEHTLFGSISIPEGASDRSISDGDLAIQTKIRNKKYGVFELINLNGDKDADRASAGVLGIFLGCSLSAIAANQNMPGPEIVRFVLVWMLSFAPLGVVGYGISTPEKLQALLVALQSTIFPTYRKRMIQHEAGHFLMSHLLGFPIQGYSTNAVRNAVEFYPLNDPNEGSDRAQQLGFDRSSDFSRDQLPDPSQVPQTPFFSEEGAGGEIVASRSVFRNTKNYTDNPFLRLPSRNQPQRSWPFRGFDHGVVDKLTVVSVAGVCSEILAFGNSEGGVADFSQLLQILNEAEPELNEREKENRIRYSIGYCMTQLRLHLGALDDLAAVMERGGSVTECVRAIEDCSNVNGNNGFSVDYEYTRRQSFRSDGVGFLERLLLDIRTVDTEENRLVEGKGGGYIEKPKPLITGDDPLYMALGISLLFLAWASAGGL